MRQGIFLLLAGAATSIIFVATKHVFCRDKSMLVGTNITNKYIAAKIYRHKTLVMTKICSSRQALLSRQKMCLSRQNFYRDKNDTCGSSRQWYIFFQSPLSVQTLVRCSSSTARCTLVIPNTGSHTVVWTHESTAHCSCDCCGFTQVRRPKFPTRDNEV